MLSPQELSSLLTLLGDSKTSLSLLYMSLVQNMSKGDCFRHACAIRNLLQLEVLTLPQRLAAYFILQQLYSTTAPPTATNGPPPPAGNPFFPVYLGALASASTPALEKHFVALLLQPAPPKELAVASSSDHVLHYQGNPPAVPNLDLKALYKQHLQYLPHDPFAGPSQEALFPPVLGKPSEVHADELSLRGFEMEFIRPVPPILQPNADEWHWLIPNAEHNLILDPAADAPENARNATGSFSSSGDIKEIFERAFVSTLPADQEAKTIQYLENNDSWIEKSGMTPEKLPDLVEKNPNIATKVLVKLISSNQITEYFSSLVTMPMSLHSMEVVNRLTTTVELPIEFLHLYITNCIAACEAIQDNYLQNRLVRLVCVFLQSLIRNKIIDVKDILTEVQAFCVEFSRIREAATLFRMLKSIESGSEQ